MTKKEENKHMFKIGKTKLERAPDGSRLIETSLVVEGDNMLVVQQISKEEWENLK